MKTFVDNANDEMTIGTIDELVSYMLDNLNKTLAGTKEGAELESEIATLTKLYNTWHAPEDVFVLTWNSAELWKLYKLDEVYL